MFGDIISKDTTSAEQIATLNIFLGQNNVNIYFSIKIDLFKPRKDKNENYEPSAPPENSNF